MKLMNMQKLLKLVATITIISGPVLPAIACANNSSDKMITTNDINVSNLDVNKSKLIAKSLILARNKKWNPNEILKKALANNLKNLDDYFSGDTIKNLVLTPEYHNFLKPDYHKPKTLEILGMNILEKIKQILQFFIKNIGSKTKDSMETLLKQLLGFLSNDGINAMIPDIKEMLTTKYQDIVGAIKSGIANHQELIVNNKTFNDIFKGIKEEKILVNILTNLSNIKSLKIENIAVLIETIITYGPVLITFMINFAEKLDKEDFSNILKIQNEKDKNEKIQQNVKNLVFALKANSYKGLLDNKGKSFTLQNIKNIFKNIFTNKDKRKLFFKTLFTDKNLPFGDIYVALLHQFPQDDVNNFFENLSGDELDDDFIAIIDGLLLKLPNLYNKFITLLDDKNPISKVEFLKNLIEIMGVSGETSIQEKSILDYLIKILDNKWFKDNVLQKIIDNKSIWEEDGNYIADFVNNSSYIQDTEPDIVYEPSAGLVFYNIMIEKQNFKFSWKFFYNSEKKLIGMKIFNFEKLS